MIYKDLVVLICDGTDVQYVAALNKDTGALVWKTPRPPMSAETGDQMKAYSTPMAITDASGRDQLICMASQWLVSLEPSTGKELWRVEVGEGKSAVTEVGDRAFTAAQFDGKQWALCLNPATGAAKSSFTCWQRRRQMSP